MIIIIIIIIIIRNSFNNSSLVLYWLPIAELLKMVQTLVKTSDHWLVQSRLYCLNILLFALLSMYQY